MIERLVCLACGLLEAREVAPSEGCYRASHALVPARVWRELYGPEADPPQPFKLGTGNLGETGILPGEGDDIQAAGDEGKTGSTEGEGGEASPPTIAAWQRGGPTPLISKASGPERSLEVLVASYWGSWGKFDVEVLLGRARELVPSITSTRDFASWLGRHGYTLERIRRKVYAQRKG